MRVGLDVTPLSARGAGIARYTIELLRALMTADEKVDIVLLANSQRPADLGDVDFPSPPTLANVPLPIRAVWTQTSLPLALSRARPPVDLCHFTNYSAPLVTGTPFVVSLHDMSLLLTPELHPRRRVLTLTPVMRATARRAHLIACPTESARQDAIRVLDLDPRRVRVVSNAVAPWFRPMDASSAASVAARYGLEPGFLLSVGTIEPRKNLIRLARVFARLRAQGFAGPLAICGGWGWKSADLKPAIDALGIADSVVFTGYVPEQDLVGLLNSAAAVAYASLYEGFGLPLVEALACGVPTVTSNRGAMAEVAADAALLADPEDDDSLFDALGSAVGDDSVRDRLRRAGPLRAAQFNHGRTADEALAAYRTALDGSATD